MITCNPTEANYRFGNPDLQAGELDAAVGVPSAINQSAFGAYRMDLRQLKYFTAVADLQSIAQASAHLGVAGPAISRSISSLEAELKCLLFERDGRGMQLTAAGKMLHSKASHILRDVELARQEVMAEGEHLEGDVTIGGTPSIIARIGKTLINRCREHLPRVRPRITEGYSAHLVTWLLAGNIDFALVNGYQQINPRIANECLATECLFAIGRPDTFDSGSTSLPLMDLLQSDLILPSAQNPMRGLIDTAAAAAGKTVSAAIEVDSAGLLKELVLQGTGCGVLPFGAVKQEVEAGSLEALPISEPEILIELGLIYANDSPPSRVGASVIAIIKDLLNEIVEQDGKHGFLEVRP